MPQSAVAHAAIALAPVGPGVGGVVGVTSGAVRLGSVVTAPHVLRTRHWLKVGWVNTAPMRAIVATCRMAARWVMAGMVDMKSIGDRPDEMLVGPAVSEHRPLGPPGPKPPVATRHHAGRPLPAAVRLYLDFCQKAFFGSGLLVGRVAVLVKSSQVAFTVATCPMRSQAALNGTCTLSHVSLSSRLATPRGRFSGRRGLFMRSYRLGAASGRNTTPWIKE
jgi:hypothetical protein